MAPKHGQNGHNGENRLLESLRPESFARLKPKLVEVMLRQGQELYRPEDRQTWIYFPAKGTMISLLAVGDDGTSVEVAITGREGMLGIPGVLGADRSNHESLVQNSGKAWRVRTEHVRDLMQRDTAFRDSLFRYIHVVFAHVAQTALCNRLHTVEERLARWMLATQDRVESPDFHMTHELLGKMLGTRRTSVSLTAATLQKAGMLRYKRGHMIVLDRKKLEKTACSCYGTMRAEMQGLYGKHRG